jgi:DNA replication and repair protein RecF
MELQQLWLTDFRSYGSCELSFSPGLTAVVGRNGEGKTNLLEAIGYLATLRSFRGAPVEALVREGSPSAVVRAEGTRDGRSLLVEAEINRAGRNRVQVNRQRLARARDLLGALRVSVFSPDDLELVKGGPALRRGYLDDALVALAPRNESLLSEVERILRQRNALLKQSGGRDSPEVTATLDVWDAKLAAAGAQLASARRELVARLGPRLDRSYRELAGADVGVGARYEAPWLAAGREAEAEVAADGVGAAAAGSSAEALAAALAAARRDDLRRGVSTVGPHRDELELRIGGLPARTHASQGEQRSLAWALRLAAHELVTEATGSAPILLLDDVFSELDPDRSHALVAHLPAGQTVLTTAGGLPPGALPDVLWTVQGGAVAPG